MIMLYYVLSQPKMAKTIAATALAAPVTAKTVMAIALASSLHITRNAKKSIINLALIAAS